eukprot:4394405-Alexandrium_andersonii.AAC.1
MQAVAVGALTRHLLPPVLPTILLRARRRMPMMVSVPLAGVLPCLERLQGCSSLPGPERKRSNVGDAREAGGRSQRACNANIAGRDDPQGAGGSAVHVPGWHGWAQRHRACWLAR